MKETVYDIFAAYALLFDLGICSSEHVFSVDYLGRSKTYLAYLRSSKNLPNIEAVVFLAVKLLSASVGFSSKRTQSTDTRRKAKALRDAGAGVLRLACEQALALSNCTAMQSNATAPVALDACIDGLR